MIFEVNVVDYNVNMDRLKRYEDLWTVNKNSYYIRMSGADYYIIDEDNMMLLIEEDDHIYFTLIKMVIEHDVRVIEYDLETKNKTNLSNLQTVTGTSRNRRIMT